MLKFLLQTPPTPAEAESWKFFRTVILNEVLEFTAIAVVVVSHAGLAWLLSIALPEGLAKSVLHLVRNLLLAVPLIHIAAHVARDVVRLVANFKVRAGLHIHDAAKAEGGSTGLGGSGEGEGGLIRLVEFLERDSDLKRSEH